MAFDFLKRQVATTPEAKASAAGPVIAYASSGVWPGRRAIHPA